MLGNGHALFQPADRVAAGIGQRLAQFLTNRTEFLRTNHKSASRRSHSSDSRLIATSTTSPWSIKSTVALATSASRSDSLAHNMAPKREARLSSLAAEMCPVTRLAM